MMGLGLRVCPGGLVPGGTASGPCGGSGPPGGRVGGPPPWVVRFRGWGGGGRSGVGGYAVRRAGCLLWSELYRGFDGEPTARPTFSELRHGPIGKVAVHDLGHIAGGYIHAAGVPGHHTGGTVRRRRAPARRRFCWLPVRGFGFVSNNVIRDETKYVTKRGGLARPGACVPVLSGRGRSGHFATIWPAGWPRLTRSGQPAGRDERPRGGC